MSYPSESIELRYGFDVSIKTKVPAAVAVSRTWNPLRELRAEGVDRELVGGKPLLRAAVVELPAHLPAMRQRVGVRIESVGEPGVLQRRQVLRRRASPRHVEAAEWPRRPPPARPARPSRHPYRATSIGCSSCSRRRNVEIRRQQLAAVGIGRFGLPVTHSAGGTACNVVAAFMTRGRIGSPSRLRDAILERAAVRADVGFSDVGAAERARHRRPR